MLNLFVVKLNGDATGRVKRIYQIAHIIMLTNNSHETVTNLQETWPVDIIFVYIF